MQYKFQVDDENVVKNVMVKEFFLNQSIFLRAPVVPAGTAESAY